MTVQETLGLAPGDLVACGKHLGTVLGVALHSVQIRWQTGYAVIHDRSRMDSIRLIDLAAEANGGTHGH